MNLFLNNTIDGENNYTLISALFLRLLAVIYFIAFFTMTFQINGLAGEGGILPLSPWLDYLLNDLGWAAYLHFPMIFWLDQSNEFLLFSTWAGCVFACLLFLNIFPRFNLVLLFIFYLSVVKAGQTFMNFQWDGLLLEAGFLAIFLRPDSKVMIFLFRWLLFRLRFMSGISKFAMGDPSWLGMTALIYYFETQPLPHFGAWYFHNLPELILIMATVLVLIVEIIVPLMMFLSRRYRLIAAWITLALQLLILLTSNHNWFNFLTIALCLFLFDDKALKRILPAFIESWLLASWSSRLRKPTTALSHQLKSILAGMLLLVGSLNIYRLAIADNLGYHTDLLLDVFQQWHIVNSYHVFPTMTTRQIEIKIEGSIDGKTWQPYEFIHRPNHLDTRPTVVLPHHPRLDWMMWFVPFHPRFLPWFDAFLIALLDNKADVTALLESNPFSEQPPNYLRVQAWRYQFTTPAERAERGNWWKRTYLGPFEPLPGKYRLSIPVH